MRLVTVSRLALHVLSSLVFVALRQVSNEFYCDSFCCFSLIFFCLRLCNRFDLFVLVCWKQKGPDGGISAARYAFLGGAHGTSNMAAARLVKQNKKSSQIQYEILYISFINPTQFCFFFSSQNPKHSPTISARHSGERHARARIRDRVHFRI